MQYIGTAWRLLVLINQLKIQGSSKPNNLDLYEPETSADGDPWFLFGYCGPQKLRPANSDENVGAHYRGISFSIRKTSISTFCALREKRRERKKENENKAIPNRRHVGATHPENWSTRSESGTIYMDAPPQSTLQEAQESSLRLFQTSPWRHAKDFDEQTTLFYLSFWSNDKFDYVTYWIQAFQLRAR